MSPMADELTALERAILDIEARTWRYPAVKDNIVREVLDLNTTRYYQLLNALLERPAALAYSPTLVLRLRRIRATRSQSASVPW